MLPRRITSIILNRFGQLSTLSRPTSLLETIPLASRASRDNEDSRGRSFWPSLSALFLAAPIAAAVAWWPFNISPAWADFKSNASDIDEYKEDAEDHSLLSLRTRQRLFFAYEKRMRDNSSLDKVFDYFSSHHTEDGSRQMLPHDLLRAIVPTYPPSKSKIDRGGSLEGERQPQDSVHASHENLHKFFMQFDLDGDGTVSYLEFLLLLTLVSIPKDDVSVIFDIVDEDGNGTIDADEFQVIMNLMQSKAVQGASKSLSFGRPAKLQHLVPATGQDSSSSGSSLLVMFFGHDKSHKLNIKRFRAFLGELHDMLIKLEFAHYLPDGKGFIPGIDFARSLVTSASLHQTYGLLDRVDSMQTQLSKTSFSFAEFDSVYRLQCNLKPIHVALEFVQQLGRPITRAEFNRHVIRFSNVRLSEQVLDTIMCVFNDGKGCLDVPLFVDVMKRKLNTVHAAKFR